MSRRCLVIGGSGVLGHAVCRMLAAGGHEVAFTYHRAEQRATSLGTEIDAVDVQRLDLANAPDIETAVARAAERLSGLDALIVCAAVASIEEVDAIDEPIWDHVFDVNLRGPFFACRAAARRMRDHGGGDLVLVGSVDGTKALPSPVHYATSKAAISGMARAMSKALGGDGIRVNVVAPGLLDEGMVRHVREDLVREYDKHCGLRRRGEASEIASVICWLATENTYLTGQTITVDGGL